VIRGGPRGTGDEACVDGNASPLLHAFLFASDGIRRCGGWGKTKGYQNL
jgi:hypothetical protein